MNRVIGLNIQEKYWATIRRISDSQSFIKLVIANLLSKSTNNNEQHQNVKEITN